MIIRSASSNKALFQALLIILASFASAWLCNVLRSDAIALIGDWSAQARMTDAQGLSIAISLEEALRLFNTGDAVFVDARARGEFEIGRIKGAVNVPHSEAEERFGEVARRLEGAKTIITYCDGESCDLSRKVAIFLKEMGFDEVKVLVNGWTLWRQANLPWEKGS